MQRATSRANTIKQYSTAQQKYFRALHFRYRFHEKKPVNQRPIKLAQSKLQQMYAQEKVSIPFYAVCQVGEKQCKMHQPGFEPGSREWESLMLPLHHWCGRTIGDAKIYKRLAELTFPALIQSVTALVKSLTANTFIPSICKNYKSGVGIKHQSR